MSIVQKLTEGIVNRDLSKEGAALITKWEQTGLLEGIGDDTKRQGMARLLENQAKEILREGSTMASGDVEGFAAVAFPLVRRVFGNLIANDLVSVQPMSLPSGLIFFLDFTFGGVYQASGQNTEPRLGFQFGKSIYGGDVVGAQITGGVDLLGLNGTDAGGPYNLRNGYSSPTGSTTGAWNVVFSGTLGSGGRWSGIGSEGSVEQIMPQSQVNKILRFDPDLVSGSDFVIAQKLIPGASQFNLRDLSALALTASNAAALTLVSRLTEMSSSNTTGVKADIADGSANIFAVFVGATAAATPVGLSSSVLDAQASFPITDNFQAVEPPVKTASISCQGTVSGVAPSCKTNAARYPIALIVGTTGIDRSRVASQSATTSGAVANKQSPDRGVHRSSIWR